MGKLQGRHAGVISPGSRPRLEKFQMLLRDFNAKTLGPEVKEELGDDTSSSSEDERGLRFGRSF